MTHICRVCKKSYNESEWEALPGAAQGRDWIVDEAIVLELRNCDCGGTMSFDPLPLVLRWVS